jgi:hypothetical protein
MSTFEYFHVFETIVFGLAFSHILVSIAKMITERKSIRVYWLHILCIATVIVILIGDYIYTFYELKNANLSHYMLVTNGFSLLVFVLLPLSGLFLSAYLIFPTHIRGTDFRQFFWQHHKDIIIVLMATGLSFVIRNFTGSLRFAEKEQLSVTEILGMASFWLFMGIFLVQVGLGIYALIWKRKWLIKTLIIANFLYCFWLYLLN